MRYFLRILVTAALLLTPTYSGVHAQQTPVERLRVLNELCEEGLVPADECASRRAALLDVILADGGEAEEELFFCNYDGSNEPPAEDGNISEFGYSESADVGSIVYEILELQGLAPSFVTRPAQVGNAAASMKASSNGYLRYIEFNPQWVSQVRARTGSNWAIYSVMAHEIGHHLQGHTLTQGGSRPPTELEADYYSGFVLQKMGATLDEAKLAMETLGSDSSHGTHPPTAERLAAISDGWNAARRNEANPMPTGSSAPTQPTATQPVAQPGTGPISVPTQPIPNPGIAFTDQCVIGGEQVMITNQNQVLSPMRAMALVGQRIPPRQPQCVFELLSNNGSYCVLQNGAVLASNMPGQVGICRSCQYGGC